MAGRFILHASRLDHIGSLEFLDWLARRYSIALLEGSYDTLTAYLERDEPQPEGIVLELTGERDRILASLDQLAQFIPESTTVYAVGAINDVAFYRQLLALGIADYLLLPCAPADIEAIFKTLQSKRGKARGAAIGFIGLAGGVGTTSLAIHVANHIGQSKHSHISLIDAGPALSSWGSSIALDYERIPIAQLSDRDDPRMSGQFEMINLHSHFQLVIPKIDLSHHIAESERVKLMTSFVRSMIQMGECIFIDLGMNGNSDELLALCDHIVLIGEPDFRTLHRVSAFTRDFESRFPYARLHLVLNKLGVRGRMEFSANDFASQSGLTPLLAFRYDAAAATKAWVNSAPLLPQSLLQNKNSIEDLTRHFDLAATNEGRSRSIPEKIKDFVNQLVKTDR